jgi:uncharacterized protein
MLSCSAPTKYMAADDSIEIEVVYALAAEQIVIQLTVRAGTTAHEAIALSGLRERYPTLDSEMRAVGIFGRAVPQDTVLRRGDRVEIYRALVADPKQARRRRARRGS